MVATALKRISSVRVPHGAPEKSQGVWKSLLEGAARTAEFEKSTFLILGKKDAGKSNLIRAMQKIGGGSRKLNEMEVYGEAHGVAGLDYAYMNVRAVDDADLAESLAKTDVWILQDTEHRHLLSALISPSHLRHLVVIICLDLSEPWTLKSQLRHWLEFATTFIQDLMKGLPVEEQDALRARLSRYIDTYRSKVEGKPADDILEEESTLKVNLGVPFIVCVCKSDSASNLDTRSCPGRADVVMAHLRHMCLPYGASLIYCCTKSTLAARNLELIYRYALHRIYDFKFVEPASFSPADSIFVPSGWDKESEIKEFGAKTVGEGLETPLEALLPPPADSASASNHLENRVDITSMNDFLETLLERDPTLLVKDRGGARPSRVSVAPGAASQAPSAQRELVSGGMGTSRKSSRAPAETTPDTQRGSTTRRHVEAPSARGDTESLRAFFQTLLTKPPQPTARPASPRRDSEKRSKEESRAQRRSSRSSTAPLTASGGDSPSIVVHSADAPPLSSVSSPAKDPPTTSSTSPSTRTSSRRESPERPSSSSPEKKKKRASVVDPSSPQSPEPKEKESSKEKEKRRSSSKSQKRSTSRKSSKSSTLPDSSSPTTTASPSIVKPTTKS